MPVRRTLGKRKRAPVRTMRRRVRRRYVRRSRVPRVLNRPHKFKRVTYSLAGASSNFSAGLTTGGGVTGMVLYQFAGGFSNTQQYSANGYNFQFQDITNYTEFSSLFDRYKLYGVSIKMIPFTNDPNTGTASSVGGINCLIHSAVDHDDSAAPTANEAGIDVLRQYNTYRVVNMAGRRVFKRFIRLNTLVAETNAAGTNVGNRVVRAGFNDMAYVTIPHYGFKWIAEFFSSSNVQVNYAMKFEFTYYFQCADPR